MDWKKTDPEFAERFRHFAFDEVVNEDGQQLPGETRYLAILATLIGCGGADATIPNDPNGQKNTAAPNTQTVSDEPTVSAEPTVSDEPSSEPNTTNTGSVREKN